MRSVSSIFLVFFLTLPAAHSRQVVRETRAPSATAPDAPWPARVRVPSRGREKGYGLIKPHQMPPEPVSPERVDAKRFAPPLRLLCYRLSERESERLSGHIVEYAREFSVDPFLLGALIRRQSGCSNSTPKNRFGVGLARISPAVHRPFLKAGVYRYWVKHDRRWVQREKRMDRFAFNRRTLRRAKANIYFAAAILSVYTEQARDLDEAFPQVPYRHPVSHMIWGDRVRGTEAEERILRDRRRLIQYYTSKTPRPQSSYRGMPLLCPLDGVPRKITSDYWSRRGRRQHRSVDFYSHIGEPVRAMADGVVRFAGYQPRRGRGRAVSPKYSGKVRRSKFGIGGLFVIIKHPKGLESGYFHLKDFTVRSGQRIKRGQMIGRVGRTGIKYSRAHLHFEIRKGKWRIKVNPMRFLAGDVLPLESTWVGSGIKHRRYLRKKHRIAKAKRRRLLRQRKLRKERRAKRLARQQNRQAKGPKKRGSKAKSSKRKVPTQKKATSRKKG